MIKHLNTNGDLGIVSLLRDYNWCLRNRSVSSSLCQYQSADRAWTFHGHGTDNMRFTVRQFTEIFNRIPRNLLDVRKLLVMSQSPNAISMCITLPIMHGPNYTGVHTYVPSLKAKRCLQVLNVL